MTRRKMSAEAGFSLLEMLVGLTLLALISVAVTQAVRTGLRMWQAAESNDEKTEWRQTEWLIEHWMSRALPPRGYDVDSRVIFEPTPAGVRFLVDGEVGRKPAGYSRIGLLAEANPVCPSGADLVLTWEDVTMASNFASAGQDKRVLIDCADSIDFEYGSESAGAAPKPEFSTDGELPRIVRITVNKGARHEVLAARLLYAR